jgi:hypothetical protein
LLLIGLALIWRYQWTMDDAFVYARYGDNLVLNGFGLVYNRGEFVEGFSSPLWMSWLAAWRATGLSYGAIWLATGLVSFAGAWWLCIRIAEHLGPRGLRIHLPLAYLAANYAVTSFFTSGLETPLLQVVALGYGLFFLQPRSKLAIALVGLSPLVRPELGAVFIFAMVAVGVRERRFPWRVLLLGGGTSLLWLGFRIYYYADFFPNTFYLKHGQLVGHGLHYFVDTFWSYHFELLALVSGIAFWRARRAGRSLADLKSRPRVEMLAAAALMTAYAIYVGGDAMHYRFLAFPFCLAAVAASGLLEEGLAGANSARKRWLYPSITALAAAVSLSFQPPQRDVHALRGAGDPHLENWISDPGRHRRRTNMRELAWFDGDDDKKRKISEDPDAFRYRSVRVTGWCTLAHFHYDERIVHDLGLTDPILARADVHADRPGHKFGLRWLARDLADVYLREGPSVEPGQLRAAAKQHRARAWIGENLDEIELIERKVYNRHQFRENLGLAFSFPGPVDVGSRLDGVEFSGYGVASVEGEDAPSPAE